MSTQVFLLDASTGFALAHRGTNTAKFDASTSGWLPLKTDTSRGSGVTTSGTTNTVAGATSGVEVTASGGGVPLEWISPPIDQDVTISGTITANIWAAESSMNANVAINVAIYRLTSDLSAAPQLIVKSTRVTEVAVTTRAVNNFTTGMLSTDYTDVAMNKGDRLRIVVFGDDAGTMGSGFTFNIGLSGTAGNDGDTFVTFTETFGFQTTDPTGTTAYLTDTASAVSTSDVDWEAWTSRGDSAASVTDDPGAGWAAPQQLQSGGTNVSWFTKPLEAFTLGGLVKVNLRASESAAAGNSSIGVEIARVDSDGTNATVWGYANRDAANSGGATGAGELATSETAYTVYVSGDDLAITDGQRLRIRIFADDCADIPTASNTVSAFVDGPTGGASGDTFLIFEQTLTEFITGPAEEPQYRPAPLLTVGHREPPAAGPPLLRSQFYDPILLPVIVLVDTPGSLTLTGQTVTLGVSANPSAGALTLTGQSPTLTLSTTPTAGALTLTGQTVTLTISANPSAGALTLTGQAPTLTVSTQPNAGQITLSGATDITLDMPTPAVEVPQAQPRPFLTVIQPFHGPPILAEQRFEAFPPIVTVTVDPGQLTLTGQTVTLSVSATPSAGSLTLNGQAPTITLTSSPSAGSLTLTGQGVTLTISANPSAGSLLLTGQGVTLGVSASPNAGQLTLTGQAPTLTISASPSAGALTLTGQGVTLAVSTSPVAGSLTLNGATDILASGEIGAVHVPQTKPRMVAPILGPPILARQRFEPAPEQVTLTVDVPGALTLTGQAVTLGVSANPNAGVLTLTGQAVTLTLTASTSAGSLTLTGQGVTLGVSTSPNRGQLTLTGGAGTISFTSTTSPGSLTLTGSGVTLTIGASVSAGMLTLAGQAVAYAQVLLTNPGTITLTGQDVELGGITQPMTITREGPKPGGAASGAVATITREGTKAGGAPSGVTTTYTKEGAKAGGAPSGTVETETREGPKTGGAPSGTVKKITKKGPG